MKEIQQEAYAKPETVQEKDTKQTVAGDLSKRLKDMRSVNDATSFKGENLSFFLYISAFFVKQLFFLFGVI